MVTRRRLIAAAGAALGGALAGLSSLARSQVIAKPARIVVGFPAGGSTDVLARLLAERLRGAYAPSVEVNYKPGASGRLGAEAVRSGDADGSQMLLTPCSILWLYPHVYKRLNYDTLRDFTPVAPVGTVAFGLAVGPAVPATVKTLVDYLQWVKADPIDHGSLASPAAGATPHFVGVMLGRAAGARFNHVAYSGGAEALEQLAAGKVPASINVLSELLPQLPGAKLRALATSGAQRSPFLPEVQTFAESGFKDATASEVFGLFVPSRTPADVVTKLNAVVGDIGKTKDFGEALAKLGYEPAGEAAAEFANTVKAELNRWASIVKLSGFDRYVPQPQATIF
jgi:tripartite-type tricarboxylate transporter receptor subunit TctC